MPSSIIVCDQHGVWLAQRPLPGGLLALTIRLPGVFFGPPVPMLKPDAAPEAAPPFIAGVCDPPKPPPPKPVGAGVAAAGIPNAEPGVAAGGIPKA